MDGFTLCQEVRSFSDVPIVMLSARDSEVDKVRLRDGRDDLSPSLFSHLELLARVRAVVRRYQNQMPSVGEVFESGNLRIITRRTVTVGGNQVRLTPTEYSLLFHLSRNAGRVLPDAPRQGLGRTFRRDRLPQGVHSPSPPEA